jgi:hypothetical protein
MADISSLLSSIGASLDHNNNIDFDAADTDNQYLTVIHQRGLLSISGPDSKKFLQGQLTCDTNLINNQQAATGASCNPKGRVIGNFTLSQWDEQTLNFSGHHESMAAVNAHLSKYIVFSKAKLSLDNDYVCLGIKTDSIATAVGSLFDSLPTGNLSQSNHNSAKLLMVDAKQGLYELWLKSAELSAVWSQLCGELTPTNSSVWDSDMIALGLASTEQNTSDLFIPQHLNMQLNGGISFTKGCYTGQEVVARMQYRGKLKRHMYRVEADTLPIAGTALFDGEREQSIGNMVQVAHAGRRMVGLAVLTDKNVESGNIYADQNGQQKLSLLSLPYSIKEAQDNQ